MSQTGGCSCGCGGHGKRNEQDERAAAPAVAQPVGEGYRPEPVQTSPEVVDAVAIDIARLDIKDGVVLLQVTGIQVLKTAFVHHISVDRHRQVCVESARAPVAKRVEDQLNLSGV